MADPFTTALSTLHAVQLDYNLFADYCCTCLIMPTSTVDADSLRQVRGPSGCLQSTATADLESGQASWRVQDTHAKLVDSMAYSIHSITWDTGHDY